MDTMKALYGFGKIGPFSELGPGGAVDLLRSWGVDAVFGGYDDHEFVDAAHTAGLRVFAEFGCFVREDWWGRYPESRPVTSEGEALPIQDGYAGVAPSIPAVRQELLERLVRLIVEHPIDGIWLDFVRWPSRWESPTPRLYQTSFDPITLAQFQADTGLVIPSNAYLPEAASWILSENADTWAAWKCRQITEWVRQASAIVQEESSRRCLLGLFGVPWRSKDLDGAIRRVMGQDFEALGSYVDVFSPMVYHRMCGKPVSWIASLTEHVHTLSGKAVWPIIQTMSLPDQLTNKEFGDAIDMALDAPGSSGAILFNLQGISEENKSDVVKLRFAAHG